MQLIEVTHFLKSFAYQYFVFNWSWTKFHFLKVEFSLLSAYGKSWITWERHSIKDHSRAPILALAEFIFNISGQDASFLLSVIII